MTREANVRGAALAKQSAFAMLLRQQAVNLKDGGRLAELAAVEQKIAQEKAAAMTAFAVLVAVALVSIAVVVAAFTFGAGATIPVVAVTAVAAGVGITAAAVTAFTQEASNHADAALDAVQACLDAAWSRRRSCRQAITTPFPLQREAEQGLCEARYLADVLLCTG
jgi:hypothetical protein